MTRQSGADALYRRVRAHPQNVHFYDAVSLARTAGFEEVRTSGSHHIFRMSDIAN